MLALSCALIDSPGWTKLITKMISKMWEALGTLKAHIVLCKEIILMFIHSDLRIGKYCLLV